jgi:UDP-glucose 4-epimerase
MRIAVTGGTNFIGSHIAEGALAFGHDVLVVDAPLASSWRDVPAGAAFCPVDLGDASEIARALRDFRPAVVCHQAGNASAVLEACLRSQVESFVLGAPRQQLAAERELPPWDHARHLRAVTLRYANVYGPRQDPSREPGVVGTFVTRMLRNEPIQINAGSRRGDDGCMRDYVFVGDVVRATMAAVDPSFAHRAMDVCTGRQVTTRALAERIRSLCESHSSICHASQRPGDAVRSVLDPTHCRALYQPTSLNAGLSTTIAWFENHSWRSEPTSERIARPDALPRPLRIARGTAA